MNIIIIGAGKLGNALVSCLTKEGHDITLIETNKELTETIVGKYDVLGISGNGANIDTLRQAGVQKADIVIATTANDELNVLCCLLSSKLGARHTVARVRETRYSKQLAFMRQELGISMVVNPELDAANEISRILRSSRTIKIESFAKGRADLVELRVEDHSPLEGVKMSELSSRLKCKVLICAVQRGEKTIIPDGRFVLQTGDRVHITASHIELEKLFKTLGLSKQRVHSAIIVGGSTTAYYLVGQLIDSGFRIKIIEQDRDKCERFSETFPKATVICGNGTNDSLMDEEGLGQYDACVALTGIDEENIIISLLARSKQVPSIITKVNNSSLLRVINELSVDNTISPKDLTANHIVKYVRSQESNDSSSVQTLYKLFDNSIEAVEFVVTEDCACTHIPLKELKKKNNLLIACIVRAGQTLIPDGNDTMEVGDSVVVVSSDLYLRNLDEILA